MSEMIAWWQVALAKIKTTGATHMDFQGGAEKLIVSERQQ
ncbi:MAG: hypothetical protein ACI97A_003298 [Planctomycetota bacterium]|jgi:hypothetical protein